MSNNKDYEKYRGMTRTEIHEELKKNFVPGKKSRNSLQEIFDEDSDLNRKWSEYLDIIDYLTPDEEEEFKKLGFTCVRESNIRGCIEKTYEDQYGRIIETRGGLGYIVEFEGTEPPEFPRSDNPVGADEERHLIWLQDQLYGPNAFSKTRKLTKHDEYQIILNGIDWLKKYLSKRYENIDRWELNRIEAQIDEVIDLSTDSEEECRKYLEEKEKLKDEMESKN